MESRSGQCRRDREDSIRRARLNSRISSIALLEWRRYHVIHRGPLCIALRQRGWPTPKGP